MTARWVIGRGLLGGAISARFSDDVFRWPIRWADPDTSSTDLTDGLAAFLTDDPNDWEIYWSAGAGVTGTPQAVLRDEVAVFDRFLGSVKALGDPRLAVGRLFLASSVGGVYAGNPTPPFTETSAVSPLSPYGSAKAEMESAARRLSEQHGLRTFIARVSNLYGPGQDLSKGQGLISVIAKTYLTRSPASIFVSMDTIRDYIFVEDCAKVVIASMSRLADGTPGSSVTKIVGSSVGTTIGALTGEFNRVLRRRPLIVLGSGNASGQARDLRVRSAVWTDLDSLVSTTLPAGINATFSSLLTSAIQSHTRSSVS